MPKVKTLAEKQMTEAVRKIRHSLKDAQEEKGFVRGEKYTQDKIAKDTNLTQATVSCVMNHPEKCEFKTFLNVCRALGLEISLIKKNDRSA